MSRKLTDVQQAVKDLREKRLDMTQLDLANALGVTPGTIARWETIRSPSGISLIQLAQFARARAVKDIAEVLERAVRQEGLAEMFFDTDTSASFNVMVGIQDNRRIAAVEREYRAMLRFAKRACAVLFEAAETGMKTTETAEYFRELFKKVELEEWKHEQEKRLIKMLSPGAKEQKKK